MKGEAARAGAARGRCGARSSWRRWRFAFVLLIGAGLLFASFRRLLAVDPGFVAERVLTASINLPRSRYQDDKALIALRGRIAATCCARCPASPPPARPTRFRFSGNHSDSVILAEGYQMRPGESVDLAAASGRRAPAISRRSARNWFAAASSTSVTAPDAPKVIIVDEKLARRFWPNQDPIGRRMYLPQDINNLLAIDDKTVFFSVIGVVHDIKLADLVSGNGEVGAYYFPMGAGLVATPHLRGESGHRSGGCCQLGSRGDSQPGSRAARVRDADDGGADGQVADEPPLADAAVARLRRGGAVPLGDWDLRRPRVPRDAAQERDRHPHRPRQQRRRDLRAGAAWKGCCSIGGGFALGAAGAFLVRKSLESQLFGVTATDPVVMIVVTGTLAFVAVRRMRAAGAARDRESIRSLPSRSESRHEQSIARRAPARTIVKWRWSVVASVSIFNRSAMAITLASTIPIASYCSISSADARPVGRLEIFDRDLASRNRGHEREFGLLADAFAQQIADFRQDGDGRQQALAS